MKLSAERGQYPDGWRPVEIRGDDQTPTFTYRLNHGKLKQYAAATAATCCAPISPAMIQRSCGITAAPHHRLMDCCLAPPVSDTR